MSPSLPGPSFAVYYALVPTGASAAADFPARSREWFTGMLLIPWIAMLCSVAVSYMIVPERISHWLIDRRDLSAALLCVPGPYASLPWSPPSSRALFVRGIEDPA